MGQTVLQVCLLTELEQTMDIFLSLLINQLPRLILGKSGASDLDSCQNTLEVLLRMESKMDSQIKLLIEKNSKLQDLIVNMDRLVNRDQSWWGFAAKLDLITIHKRCYLCCVELGKGKRSSQTCFPQDCLQNWQPNHTCSHSWRFSKFQSSVDLLSWMCWNQRRWWSKQIA